MSEFETLPHLLTQARRDLVRAAMSGAPPPRAALGELENWTEELALLPAETVTAGMLAHAWGNLQLLLIECGLDGDDEHAAAWRRVRRSAEEGFMALLDRHEWLSLRPEFGEAVLPLLADAIGLPRAGRIDRCIAAIDQLRALAYRTSGLPHAWSIHQIAATQYPLLTVRGWIGRRDIDVTPRRVQAVAQALAEEIRRAKLQAFPLPVGYDSRVHARELAQEVTEVMTANGIPVHLCLRDTPTPALREYLTQTLRDGSAGMITCTASSLPVSDPGAGGYTGHEYQGIRYYLPSGGPPADDACQRISRRAAELLLEEWELPPGQAAAGVTMIDPRETYCAQLLLESGYLVPTLEGDEELARESLRDYWGASEALVIIDEMYGASRGYLSGICTQLGLRYEVMHGDRTPTYGTLGAANPEPPYLADLLARVKELRDERHPLIGLAFDAEADRFSVVDETGSVIPANAILVLLTEYLLTEAYWGEPGAVLRSRTATRVLDRLVELPVYADCILTPTYPEQLPPYMRQPAYQCLAGNPRLLQGAGVYVGRADARKRSERLLIAGDARGGITLDGHPDRDGLRAALLVLQCCAVRRSGVRELWQRLQQRLGPAHAERLELRAPDATRLALVNRALDRYRQVPVEQLATPAYQLGGCTVEFAGGMRDRFVEWALADAAGQPAYLSITRLMPEPTVRLEVEAQTPGLAHRLLVTVGEQLQELLEKQLHGAETPWDVIEVLANVTSPLTTMMELPGTLTCQLAEEAYVRLQELARPGREAPELLRFVTDHLRERQPEKARVLAACRLDGRSTQKRTPPPPRVHWESEGEL